MFTNLSIKNGSFISCLQARVEHWVSSHIGIIGNEMANKITCYHQHVECSLLESSKKKIFLFFFKKGVDVVKREELNTFLNTPGTVLQEICIDLTFL